MTDHVMPGALTSTSLGQSSINRVSLNHVLITAKCQQVELMFLVRNLRAHVCMAGAEAWAPCTLADPMAEGCWPGRPFTGLW